MEAWAIHVSNGELFPHPFPAVTRRLSLLIHTCLPIEESQAPIRVFRAGWDVRGPEPFPVWLRLEHGISRGARDLERRPLHLRNLSSAKLVLCPLKALCSLALRFPMDAMGDLKAYADFPAYA